MTSYQDITHDDRTDGRSALFVADECNHSAWFRLADIDRADVDEPHVLYMARCEDCDIYPAQEDRRWRRVWVQV